MKNVRYKDIVSSTPLISEECLRRDYKKRYGEITESLKYVENIRGINEITIFASGCEGLELLKNAKKIIIIENEDTKRNTKIIKRIKKLSMINKKVKVLRGDEIKYTGMNQTPPLINIIYDYHYNIKIDFLPINKN